MKRKLILMLTLILAVGFLTAGTVSIVSPNGGEKLVIGSSCFIKWNSSGLKKGIKITLWKDNALIGVISTNFNAALNSFKWKIGHYNGGIAKLGGGYKIKIKEKGTAVTDMSNKPFSIIEKKGIIKIDTMPKINNSVMVAPQFQPKKNVLDLSKMSEPFGKLIPSSSLADFGSTVNLKIEFKNAIKVKVFNRKTKKQIYFWTGQKPGTNTLSKAVILKAVENAYEMEVWGSKSTYIANCFVTARPVVNEFRIEHTTMYKVVHYSFSGCEHAFLKKFDTKSNSWIRVFKLNGDGYIRKGIYPKKGSIKLVVGALKKTRYVLVLIGEMKQGVVRSKELVENFWTDQYTK